mmetsp:Transcript_26255/g.66774  ORF Transcript_26255/g.66774 Transcript_26255/m.66774 type:complete len:213 (+) Transcript_26255:1043-1681(+)
MLGRRLPRCGRRSWGFRRERVCIALGGRCPRHTRRPRSAGETSLSLCAPRCARSGGAFPSSCRSHRCGPRCVAFSEQQVGIPLRGFPLSQRNIGSPGVSETRSALLYRLFGLLLFDPLFSARWRERTPVWLVPLQREPFVGVPRGARRPGRGERAGRELPVWPLRSHPVPLCGGTGERGGGWRVSGRARHTWCVVGAGLSPRFLPLPFDFVV